MTGHTIPLADLLKAQAALKAVFDRDSEKPLSNAIGIEVARALGTLNAHVSLSLAALPPVEVAA